MVVRSFTSTDCDGIKDLVTTVMNKEFHAEKDAYMYGDLDDIPAAYGNIRDKFLIAEEDARVVGTVGVKEDSATTALLRRFFVHSSHRGRGIGSMLVDIAIDFCKLNGYKNVVFRATTTMKQAIKLLTEKKGFVEAQRHPFGPVEIIILKYKIH